ncbi:farnesyl-diphosphate farnesyltransferase-like protein [Thermochaetoides thermophila DSM 1495]|uniref:Squalene synthase n=1 Tax=Chaetomium thermophilum (strain DSM 1495 / CBS 144.50 / IMI 039719) TaxID=759272 RepID=G0SAU6_CHATD|nr:farnesyl-diphosphate farnesyltransferase-like protein [Thermochaetoides thermophila DSM 1495]EGS19326.1 farnesyl-diphosphate farnesyltransferase-like protein [Thermochaetoides thermophila DSM 1495]
MVAAKQLVYFLLHPNELRNIIQWKVWHQPVHARDPSKESETQKQCFYYLNKTSRSFAAVIQELNPELLMPVCLFYLVLRGLDTIEDDMTIDVKKKEPLLRSFHDIIEQDGWTFHENGPNEKDRELLVHFDVVITELKKIKPEYYEIIKDITKKMGDGMADYALNAEHNINGVSTVPDYELYCHYVAGLVGEGLTRLFVKSGLATPKLMDRPELTESMGQFLQKTNIIRDVHEDWLDKRRFWPKEIWSKYVDKWDDLFDPKNREKALHCSSEMVLNALKHAEECLFYMAHIRDQSVFNFVAIPQSMAIATLELVFRNPAIFERNVKITKGDACRLMIESTQNLRVIEQFIETLFPSQDPNKIAAEKINGMDAWETFYLALSVFGAIGVMTVLSVGIAYLLGAQLDDFFKNLDQALGGSVKPITTATVEHAEL